ncbi:MAG: 2-phospho-L-lactate guanylyltransferase [Chloroflexota bacterium]
MHSENQVMPVWAIVPVKPLLRGKSRLSEMLSLNERLQLNRELLIHTVKTLSWVTKVEQILVVSRDMAALSLAREHGARTLLEKGRPHLNIALSRATMVARSHAAVGVLILPADLPLFSPEDIFTILLKAGKPPTVVAVPDRHWDGTNALLISPPGVIPYSFGPRSFERHCELAKQANVRLEICELSSLALDVDYPEDLQVISQKVFSDVHHFSTKISSGLDRV